MDKDFKPTLFLMFEIATSFVVRHEEEFTHEIGEPVRMCSENLDEQEQ